MCRVQAGAKIRIRPVSPTGIGFNMYLLRRISHRNRPKTHGHHGVPEEAGKGQAEEGSSSPH